MFEEEDSKVLCSSIHDHMNADMEKPRTVGCLTKGLMPLTDDFLSAIAQKEKLFDESYFKVDDFKISFFLDCQALKF